MTPDLHGFGPALAAGTWMTIQLALAALAVGLVLGLLGALAKTSSYKPLQWLGSSYSTIVRGVPELLWVLLIYFGTVGLMRSLADWLGLESLELNAFAAGTIALGLCFGAYATEVFRGAILAIPEVIAKPDWPWACRARVFSGRSSCRKCGASPCPAWAICS